ncbi:MAG: chemotaxis-specific protein-glutamate methyltransferase CheB [Pirellulales bacterium]
MIRIAIVNDLRMAAETLRRIVVSLPETEVAWIAENGEEAVAKCQVDLPDLVLMDLKMPVMNGVDATRQIMQQSPCPILVVTATVTGNCNEVYETLGHGALDAVNTPVLGRDGSIPGDDELIRKIRNIVRLRCGNAPGLTVATPIRPDSTSENSRSTVPLLAIGASTGGPQAISKILAGLALPLEYSVVIVQHLDKVFVPGLIDWLAGETNTSLQVIEAGQRPTLGTVHVACTSDHLLLDSEGVFQYSQEPLNHVYRPSVDVFFNSLLKAPVRPGIALLLTGMGRDGAAGMKALKQAGWKTIAQDQATSIVWGMPGAAVQLQAADQVLPLDSIGPTTSTLMKTLVV